MLVMQTGNEGSSTVAVGYLAFYRAFLGCALPSAGVGEGSRWRIFGNRIPRGDGSAGYS